LDRNSKLQVFKSKTFKHFQNDTVLFWGSRIKQGIIKYDTMNTEKALGEQKMHHFCGSYQPLNHTITEWIVERPTHYVTGEKLGNGIFLYLCSQHFSKSMRYRETRDRERERRARAIMPVILHPFFPSRAALSFRGSTYSLRHGKFWEEPPAVFYS
jgi:hypothetical protein